MKAFTYVRPTGVEEAASELAEHGEGATVIAGGQTLLLAMKERLATPSVLVSLQDVAETRGISYSDDGVLTVGAATPYRELRHADLRDGHSLLCSVAAEVGDIPVQRMGTPGGALCHADPVFDASLAAVAADGEVELASASGSRTLAVSDFLVGAYSTALEPGELMTSIRFPAAGERERSAFVKHRLRRFDPAIVSVACVLGLAEDGRVESARIALGAVGPVPARATDAEELVTGETLTEELAREAGERALDAVDAGSSNGNARFSSEYKRDVLPTLVARALRAATNGKE